MFGFYNLLLSVNVSQQSFEITPIPDSVLTRKLGGKGLAAHLLLESNPPGADPLGPSNNLIFATGPMAGTSIWGTCRYGIFTKSPRTHFFSQSYSGGTALEYITATGMDAIMVYGASDTPVWLEISDASVAFHPADDLMGLDGMETQNRISNIMNSRTGQSRNSTRRCGVITIASAGKDLVSFAVSGNDYRRIADRTGMGAVMESKNIKAVAFSGSSTKQVAHPDALKAFKKEMAQQCEVKSNACLQCFMSSGILSTVPKGTCRLRELSGKPKQAEPVDKKKKENHATAFCDWEDRRSLFDTFLLCPFYRDMYQWEELSTMINAVTGLKLDIDGMRNICKSVSDDIRCFNLRESLVPGYDHLPGRSFKQGLP